MNSKSEVLKCARDIVRLSLPGCTAGEAVIHNIETAGRVEQALDHLAILRVGQILRLVADKVVFEEDCARGHRKKGHDAVIYHGEMRIVNEVMRIRPTDWGQKQREIMLERGTKRMQSMVLGKRGPPLEFLELTEDPNRTTTGWLDDLLKRIEERADQFDRGFINILWVVSEDLFYERDNIQDAAHFLAVQRGQLPSDQPGFAHQKPEHLTALGWMWDGDPDGTSAVPHVFLMAPAPSKISFGERMSS